MNTRHLSSIVLTLLALVIFGCKGDTGPAGGPLLTGSITGFVALIQADASKPPDYSGVTISVDSGILMTTSDTAGKWTINGLTEGIHTITYSKPGYGMYKLENQQFVGGGTFYEGRVTLEQPPAFTVTLDPVKTITDSNSVYVTGAISGFPRQNSLTGYILIALGTDPNASDANKYVYATTYYLSGYSNSFSTHIYRSTLEYAGLSSGQHAYVTAYPLSGSSTLGNTSYIDQTSGRSVYTALGTPSVVIPVTIP